MAGFLELLLSVGGRAPAAIIDRLSRMASAVFSRRRRRRRLGPPPEHYLSNNHLRRDIGLPPVGSDGWRM